MYLYSKLKAKLFDRIFHLKSTLANLTWALLVYFADFLGHQTSLL